MPGSPPMSTTPPSTSPPPSTRSNSAMSVGSRGKSFASTSPRETTSAAPARLAKRCAPADLVASAAVSMSVFHSLQCGHWPCHLRVVPPHSVQVKTDFDFANDVSSVMPQPHPQLHDRRGRRLEAPCEHTRDQREDEQLRLRHRPPARAEPPRT